MKEVLSGIMLGLNIAMWLTLNTERFWWVTAAWVVAFILWLIAFIVDFHNGTA